ncbi:MAG TPA: AraC family transcriptional regulator [Methylotenera sp.]|nr:AraC family transcriptional regulator [Methylotenera sp.]HPH05615.1 AraC family transcriptional regulator [Methylotenera sp.]HPN01958.1 AraC family transcriptional regulator [Methylotenera sp.]
MQKSIFEQIDGSFPHPMIRAPRLTKNAKTQPGTDLGARLHLAPAALQGAIVAIIYRDISGLEIDSHQRLTHFAASELMSLSWFQGSDVYIYSAVEDKPAWRPLSASTVISGSQQTPSVSWSVNAGRAGMICFTADVAHTLFGIDVVTITNKFVPAQSVLPSHLWPLLEDLINSPDDISAIAALEHHLAPRWQLLHGRQNASPTFSQIGRHWVERLAWQARDWSRSHSQRHVERRIKALTGRSLRQWQALVKTEGVFFAARSLFENGQEINWANIAFEEGFADQAHLIRETKRITGFTPIEFGLRFAEDESFWLYRLWL